MHDTKDYSALTATTAKHLFHVTMDAFDSEKSPDGKAWDPLKPATIKARRVKGYGPGPILVESGDLKRSIDFEGGRTSAKVGSTEDYAELQNSGGFNEAGWEVPARPFLGIGDEDQLHSVIDQALSSVLDW